MIGRWAPTAAALLLACLLAVPATAGAARTQMLYSISAHPDDEAAGWPLLQGRSDTYTVFVTMTRGEATKFCLAPGEVPPDQRVGDPGPANGIMLEALTAETAVANAGPWGYQGPGSPVGEPDKGERHPLGNPWQGRGTQACSAARLASWHWFLDDMAGLDPSVPAFGIRGDPKSSPSYRGSFCRKATGCALVWSSAQGARVAFDVPDGKLTAAQVTARIQQLRKRRRHWGLPTLPEVGVFANAFYYDGAPHATLDPACTYPYKHTDHAAVQQAIFDTDQHAGPQYGVTCVNDRRFIDRPGPPRPWDPALLWGMLAVDPVDESRDGAFQRNYGWLEGTYGFLVSESPAFWLRSFDP